MPVRTVATTLAASAVAVLVGAIVGAMLAGAGPGRAAGATGHSLGERAGFSPGAPFLWGSDADLARDLDGMAATGARWLRVDFDWPSIESKRGVFRWANSDRVVSAALARGLRILALPVYTPSWARPPATSDKHPPSDPGDYARFVEAAVQRYSPLGVKAWEIWNEPNIATFWQPAPDAAAYTRLLTTTAAAIRGADPEAIVLTGGTAPALDNGTNIAPATFLSGIYRAGGAAAFDAVAHHPYHYPYPVTARGDWNSFWAVTPKLRELMVANGDAAKQIWATEYGAPTGTSSQAVSEQGQADLLREGVQRWAAWDYTGPMFIYAWRDAGTRSEDREENFGVVRHDHTVKPAAATVTELFGGGRRRVAVVRLAGEDRVQTSVVVSRVRFASARTVVVASAADFPDALVGAPLAAAQGGPLLLTDRDRLPAEVAEELRRIGARTAIVLGGTAAVKETVEDSLSSTGVTVRRIAGEDRFDTAAQVAAEVGEAPVVAVASGEQFPDAAGAGALGLPVLLTRRTDLPGATSRALATTSAQPVVVGGASTVDPSVLPDAPRLAGADRYETSSVVAEWGVRNGRFALDEVVVTRGDLYPDALAAGALRRPLLLRPPGHDSPPLPGWLHRERVSVERVTAVGGTAGIGDRALAAVASALEA